MKKALLFGFITGASNRAGISESNEAFSMTRLMITIVAVALLSGCAATEKYVKDLSTGDETALINASNRSVLGWNRSRDCYITWPAYAISIVVDAGPVIFVETCKATASTWSTYGPEETWDISHVFQFDAEVGKTYEIRGRKCPKLVNVTDGNNATICEPFFMHGFKDLSTGDNKAVVRSIGDTQHNYCAITVEQKRFGFLFVDAGSNTIDVICRKTGTFGGNPRILTSSFDFDTQTGHTYTFSAEDEECIKLLDITSDEFVIACESFEQHDEEE